MRPPADTEIRHAPLSWERFEDKLALVTLVDLVQTGAPYYDAPERTDSAEWLPGVFAEANLILLAYRRSETGAASEILGYFITQPFASYGDIGHPPAAFGVDLERCVYVAEVGVSEAARGAGLGSRLLEDAIAAQPGEARHLLLRTLVADHRTGAPNPAIDFYRRHGFEIVRGEDGAPLVVDYNHRRRLFMRRALFPASGTDA